MNNEQFVMNHTVSPTVSLLERGSQVLLPQQVNLENVEDFSKVCRMCATITELVIPIFEKEGLQNLLSVKMNQHLPIQVTEQDLLPRVVCYQCANTLLAWHELVECCLRADEALRTSLQVKSEHKQNRTQSASVKKDQEKAQECKEPRRLWHSSERETFPEIYPIDIQNDAISDRSLSEEEDDLPLSSLANKKIGDLYSTFYNTLVKFRDHLFTEHAADSASDSSLSNDDEESINEEFDNVDDLTQSNMRKDKMDEDTRLELHEVQTRINGKIFYACKVCDKKLSSCHTYLFHKRIHTGERPCVCHICGKQFRVPNGLQRHLTETHERTKRLTCGYCQKTFANSQNLKQHTRIHTGERPFACVVCGKRFRQSGSLYVHLKTHVEQYPHQCAQCGAKFRLRSGLTRHKLKHSGEKAHACGVCGAAFGQRYELTSHQLAHSEARPHACAQCGAAFRQRRALRHHARRLHDHTHTFTQPPHYSSVVH